MIKLIVPIFLFIIKSSLFFCSCLLFVINENYAQVYYPGINPGKAIIAKGKDNISLKNNVLSLSVYGFPDKLKSIKFIDKENDREYVFGSNDLFSIVLFNGDSLPLDQFSLGTATQPQKGMDKNGPYVKTEFILGNSKGAFSPI